jgi:hypothetical protein
MTCNLTNRLANHMTKSDRWIYVTWAMLLGVAYGVQLGAEYFA